MSQKLNNIAETITIFFVRCNQRIVSIQNHLGMIAFLQRLFVNWVPKVLFHKFTLTLPTFSAAINLNEVVQPELGDGSVVSLTRINYLQLTLLTNLCQTCCRPVEDANEGRINAITVLEIDHELTAAFLEPPLKELLETSSIIMGCLTVDLDPGHVSQTTD